MSRLFRWIAKEGVISQAAAINTAAGCHIMVKSSKQQKDGYARLKCKADQKKGRMSVGRVSARCQKRISWDGRARDDVKHRGPIDNKKQSDTRHQVLSVLSSTLDGKQVSRSRAVGTFFTSTANGIFDDF